MPRARVIAGRRLQGAYGTLQIRPLRALAPVEAGVLDRGGGPAREHDDRLLVRLVELAALLLGQVKVAPRFAADQDRDPEEAGHGRVAGREAVGLGVRADVRKAQRARVADQDAEDAPAAGQVADRPMRGGIDPGGQEALELPAVGVEHAERRVPRPCQRAGRLDDTLQDGVVVELRQDLAADVDQPAQRNGTELAGTRPQLARPSGFRHAAHTTLIPCPPEDYGSATVLSPDGGTVAPA